MKANRERLQPIAPRHLEDPREHVDRVAVVPVPEAVAVLSHPAPNLPSEGVRVATEVGLHGDHAGLAHEAFEHKQLAALGVDAQQVDAAVVEVIEGDAFGREGVFFIRHIPVVDEGR